MIHTIRLKYASVQKVLHERGRRIWAATAAQQLGWGGISLVEKAIGMSHTTIRRGLREIQSGKVNYLFPEQSRLQGGGRKKLTEQNPDIPDALESLIDPVMRGDPESPLRWTCKSTRLLANELNRQGYTISASSVGSLLHELEYSLQGNRKTREGTDHPDRNDQFLYINDQVKRFLHSGQPVISVDTKKKENLGNFSNKGREYHPKADRNEHA